MKNIRVIILDGYYVIPNTPEQLGLASIISFNTDDAANLLQGKSVKA